MTQVDIIILGVAVVLVLTGIGTVALRRRGAHKSLMYRRAAYTGLIIFGAMEVVVGFGLPGRPLFLFAGLVSLVAGVALLVISERQAREA